MHSPGFSVSGKIVVITGALGGIGLAMTRAFLQAGASVAAIVRRSGEWQGLDAAHPAALTPHMCDLSDLLALQTSAAAIIAQHRRVDVLINNACLNNLPGDNPYDLSVYEQIRTVGLDAPYVLCSLFAEHMAQHGGGSIINITSINAHAAWPGNPAYVTVKGGLRMLTKAVARDYGPRGVRANNISPGYIHTAMTDKSFADPAAYQARSDKTMLGRWGLPREVADTCLFLASDASSYITGADITVDGGWLAKGL